VSRILFGNMVHRSRYRRLYLVALFIPLFSSYSWAATVMVIVTKDHIVIASDGKELLSTAAGGVDSLDPAQNIVVFNNATAIAISGFAEINISKSGGTSVFHFSALELLKGVKDSLPRNAPISDIERVVVEKMKREMDKYLPYFVNEPVDLKNAPPWHSLDFIVAGYEAGVPIVHKITLEFNQSLKKISSPIVTPEDTSVNGPRWICSGICKSIILLMTVPNSGERRVASVRYPAAFKFSGGDPIQLADAAADFIRVESELNRKDADGNVGGPINLVTLRQNKKPLVKTLPK
jgi:hypothetical protein